jgi:hypothetical protein
MSFNQATFIGNLGQDATRNKVGDQTVCNFSIAVNKKTKDKEETLWIQPKRTLSRGRALGSAPATASRPRLRRRPVGRFRRRPLNMRRKLFGCENGPLTVRLFNEDDPDGYVVFVDRDENVVMSILRREFEAMIAALQAQAKYEDK